MEEEYQRSLEDLVAGKLDKLEVTAADFMKFQPVLMNFQQRKRIVGIAQRNGVITYHYEN
ncbi:hypothetical protein [Liquorilactobacillus satsumensis]|uniref:Uncharacterized protein n=1 Tax=Liquorilactobacillus satsumensis DSM 16230 = JCM 12392 TaxID=1423801 RepID=A0A0R1UWY0_9LACO|nr:hypothetical protein [Liquorilactobacillus satsumensis]KRL97745.1 hypothetical protein FD50_GL001312 [Liquorilactobacillus satsumensis DSM 16230 = JCM 12392]MCC7666496.1 hypothetical protein [Liquorilactobacillus satsumensis]MCP9312907.1 hypothetical protein [Liquorilactobacillus satsumensis]MCP9329744.1 hypothetical protein [Liquorilactobacillus satsumensis]MCP9357538.1 hypothetical protein [Liquorilactobacillus satsumensis]